MLFKLCSIKNLQKLNCIDKLDLKAKEEIQNVKYFREAIPTDRMAQHEVERAITTGSRIE